MVAKMRDCLAALALVALCCSMQLQGARAQGLPDSVLVYPSIAEGKLTEDQVLSLEGRSTLRLRLCTCSLQPAIHHWILSGQLVQRLQACGTPTRRR